MLVKSKKYTLIQLNTFYHTNIFTRHTLKFSTKATIINHQKLQTSYIYCMCICSLNTSYFQNNNKEEEILVTILPTKGVIRIKS